MQRTRSEIPKLLSDLSEARDRLDQALKRGALQRQLVAESCRVLSETLKAIKEKHHIPKEGPLGGTDLLSDQRAHATRDRGASADSGRPLYDGNRSPPEHHIQDGD